MTSIRFILASCLLLATVHGFAAQDSILCEFRSTEETVHTFRLVPACPKKTGEVAAWNQYTYDPQKAGVKDAAEVKSWSCGGEVLSTPATLTVNGDSLVFDYCNLVCQVATKKPQKDTIAIKRMELSGEYRLKAECRNVDPATSP